MKKYYTTSEISSMLGVTAATVNAWINSDELPSYKTPGGHNRIKGSVLLDFINQNKIPIPSELDTNIRPKVLVVEDDPHIVVFVEQVLKKTEYEIITEVATDGFMAGRKMATYKPDIIILDIMLPGLDGFEICRRIREQLPERTKVVAVTASPSEEYKRRIIECGADEFLKKPMQVKDLKNILDKFISSFADKYSLIKRKSAE